MRGRPRDAASAAERAVVARRKAGWRDGWREGGAPPRALLPLAGPPLRVPSGLSPPPPPGPLPLCPPPPLGVPSCPWSPPSRAPPSLRGGRVEGWVCVCVGGGWGGRVCSPAFVLGAGRPRSPRRPRGALGASRDVRRGGGPPWCLPGSGPPVPREGPQSLGSCGVPAVCRLPPPALDGSAPVRRTSVPTLPSHSASLPPPLRPPPPRPRARVWLLSFPRLRSTSHRALPACAPLPAAAPPPSAARGAWVAGAGRGGEGVRRAGVSRKREGSGPPRWLLGGRDGEEGVASGGGVGSGGGARRAWLRHGPAAPGFVPCGAGRGRDRRRGGGGPWPRPVPSRPLASPRLASPRLACPPPPVQVPSASRRGGLKTLWGSPVRLGSGRSGPWGGVPSPPDSAARPHPRGRGCRATPRSSWPSGGGYPTAAGPCVRVCPVSSRCVWGGRWEPPGRLWGCPSSPLALGGAGRMPLLSNLSDLPSLISFVSTGRPEAPSGECAVPEGGGLPSGGWPPLNAQNSYDS